MFAHGAEWRRALGSVLAVFGAAVNGEKYRQCVDFGRAGFERVPQGARISGEVAVCAQVARRWLFAWRKQGRRRGYVLSPHRLGMRRAPLRAEGT